MTCRTRTLICFCLSFVGFVSMRASKNLRSFFLFFVTIYVCGSYFGMFVSSVHLVLRFRFRPNQSTTRNNTKSLSEQDFSQSHATTPNAFRPGLQPITRNSTNSLSDQDFSQPHATVPNRFQTRTSANHTPQYQTRFQTRTSANHTPQYQTRFQTRTSANHTPQHKLAFRPGLQPTTRYSTKLAFRPGLQPAARHSTKLAFRPGPQPNTRNSTKSLSISDQDLSYNSKLYPQ